MAFVPIGMHATASAGSAEGDGGPEYVFESRPLLLANVVQQNGAIIGVGVAHQPAFNILDGGFGEMTVGSRGFDLVKIGIQLRRVGHT